MVQRQSSDEKSNPPSEEEIRVVQEKWRAFEGITDADAYRWQALRREMRGPEDSGEPVTTSYNSTSPTMPTYTPKNRRIPLWKKFFYRTISYIPLEKLC